jgi:hypothetical protein
MRWSNTASISSAKPHASKPKAPCRPTYLSRCPPSLTGLSPTNSPSFASLRLASCVFLPYSCFHSSSSFFPFARGDYHTTVTTFAAHAPTTYTHAAATDGYGYAYLARFATMEMDHSGAGIPGGGVAGGGAGAGAVGASTDKATSSSTPRKFSIRSNFGKARQPRSRKNRPCDACRRRKTACVITSEPPCENAPLPLSFSISCFPYFTHPRLSAVPVQRYTYTISLHFLSALKLDTFALVLVAVNCLY